MEFLDIFSDDAFSLVSMVAAVNSVDSIPGRAGETAFAGVGEGVATTTAVFEQRSQVLALIQSTPRGAPAPQQTEDKGTVFNINIPQIKKERTIGAHEVMGIREFGSTNALRSVQSVVNQQMQKIVREMDMTLEHLRLSALKGIVKDADGTKLVNLYDAFGVAAPSDFNFDLGNASADIRGICQDVVRYMQRNAKTTLPPGYKVWAFCGDTFFDSLISHANVKAVYQNWAAAEAALGGNFAFRVFPFAGIFFENYAGTDDGSDTSQGTVGIDPDECRFFLTGVPGLYAEYYAPADFFDTVNTLGLPRYARIAPDNELQRFVKLHVQQNPLPVCLRPRTLVRGVRTASITSDEPASGN